MILIYDEKGVEKKNQNKFDASINVDELNRRIEYAVICSLPTHTICKMELKVACEFYAQSSRGFMVLSWWTLHE